MLDASSFFAEHSEGGLAIWEMPTEGEIYTVGVDTSEGVKDGDWSAAEVIRASDCAQMAEWRCLEEPHYWGRKCCLLATAYNNALLGFETGASAHGMTAANYARDFGYPNLYLRSVYDETSRKQTEKLGFRTDQKTKPRLIDRVRLAVSEGHRIYSEGLIRECMAMKLEDGGPTGHKIVSEEHDDLVIGYGVALLIRDETFTVGLPGQFGQKKRALDRSERHWQEYERSMEMAARGDPHRRARRRRHLARGTTSRGMPKR